MAGRGKRESSHADGIGPARLVGLTFVAAVALVFGWALIQLFSADGLHLGARSTGNARIEGVLLHTDDRTLTVSFTGNNPATTFDSPCWEGYDIRVTEDPTIVHIEIKEIQHVISAGGGDCAFAVRNRTETVTLSQPLAGRTVIEGYSGAPIIPFPANSLLTLDPIPKGWTLADTSGGSAMWNLTWTLAATPGGPLVQPSVERITVSQAMPGSPTAGPPGHPSGTAPPGPPPIAATVRGHAGTLEGGPSNRTLKWDERGTTVTILATHAGPAGVQTASFTDDELVAVAERLV